VGENILYGGQQGVSGDKDVNESIGLLKVIEKKVKN
jgi:hypothetical protein